MVRFWREHGVRIVLYLDDGWCINDTFELGKSDAEFVYKSLADAGFLVNREKSIFTPCQSLTWLGLIWDSDEFSLRIPEQRISEVLNGIDSLFLYPDCVSARKLAQVCGRIISMMPVIGNVARIQTRYLHRCIEARRSWDYMFGMSDQSVINELLYWKSNVVSLNVRKLPEGVLSPSVVVHSDASGYACGAFSCQLQHIFHKMWTDCEAAMSSSWRELKSIELYLHSSQCDLKGKTVKVFTDNKSCVSIISCGSSKPHLHELSLSIFELCAKNDISLEVQWIPRDLNTQADQISKFFDFDDWAVSTEFFQFVDALYGPHTVDRFADGTNTKLPVFFSRFLTPGTSGVDAFSVSWEGENNWLVPPIYLVPRVIQHCVASGAVGTLVVPKWPSSPFWPLIFSNSWQCHKYIADVLEFSESSDIFRSGSYKNSLFGSTRFKSKVLVVRIEPFC